MPRDTFAIITGFREIDARLKTLEPRIRNKVIRKAIRSGIKIVAAEVREQTPVLTGTTRARVKVRALKSRERGSIGIEVRIKADEKTVKVSKSGKRAFTPAIVHFGRKGVAPDPFMRRAYDSKGEEARDVAVDEIRSGAEEEIARR